MENVRNETISQNIDSNFPGIFNILLKKRNKPISQDERSRIFSVLNPKKNSSGEYVDVFGKSISYKNNPNLKKVGVYLSYGELILNEYYYCSKNPLYFINNYCKILTKDGISYIQTRDYQNDLLDALTSKDDLVLNMPRQSGKSITTALYLIHQILFNPNKIVGILSNKLSLSMEILDKIKKIYVELPLFLQQGIVSWNKTYIELENGCKVITSATNNDSFRGYTIHILVVDEVAFISNQNWEMVEDSIFPSQYALSEHKNILISTPNGMNHWYYKVKNAKLGLSGYKYFEVDWKIVPRYDKYGKLITPEQFKEQIVQKFGLQHFLQNYALEFLGSSKTLISADALKELSIIEPKSQTDNIIDNLKIYEYPQNGKNYVIACDPNKGGMDNIGIQVLDVTHLPFKQVACSKLNISYLSLPNKLSSLGSYYHNALIVIENNLDNSICDALFYEYEYEYVYKERGKKCYGFRTTKRTKRLILSLMKRFLESKNLILVDNWTIQELNTFVDNEKGSYEAQDGFHDDMVMSLALAFAPFIEIQNFKDYKGFVAFMEEANKSNEVDFNIMCDLMFSTEITDDDVDNIKNVKLFAYWN